MFEYLRIRESFATMFFIIWGMMAKLDAYWTYILLRAIYLTPGDSSGGQSTSGTGVLLPFHAG